MKKSLVFLYSCLAFIIGIALASFFNISFFIGFIVMVSGFVVLCVFVVGNKKRTIVGFVLICLALGILRYNISIPKVDESDIQYYNDSDEVTFVGTVVGEPDARVGNVKLKIKIRALKVDRVNRVNKVNNDINEGVLNDLFLMTDDFNGVKGDILVTTNLYPEYEYGDELEITCELQRPKAFKDFDYEKYLARYDIYSVCYYPEIRVLSRGKGNRVYAGILRVKEKLKSMVEQGLPEPQASILSALALGSRQGISEELRDKFSRVGISHIMAISGLHITLLAGILLSLLIRLGFWRKQAFWLASVFLVLYIIMIGAPASAVRAGMMGFLVMLAMNLGRLSKSLNTLLFVAVLMLLVNPRILATDIGFQLSFLAVLGIIYFSPWFSKWFKKIPAVLGIRDILVMTFSAQVLVLPLLAYHFGQVSIVAPIVNILVIPILPLVLIFGFGATLGGIMGIESFQPLLQVLFVPTWLFLTYVVKMVEIFSQIPFAGVEISQMPIWVVGVIYMAIGFGVWRLRAILYE